MEKGPSTWGEEWTSDESEASHFDDHGDEMGFETIDEYTAAAQEFAKSSGKSIKAFKATNGSTYKYNSNTNEFMIISKDGKIVTYFEPTRGEDYFYDQFEYYGDYFIE